MRVSPLKSIELFAQPNLHAGHVDDSSVLVSIPIKLGQSIPFDIFSLESLGFFGNYASGPFGINLLFSSSGRRTESRWSLKWKLHRDEFQFKRRSFSGLEKRIEIPGVASVRIVFIFFKGHHLSLHYFY